MTRFTTTETINSYLRWLIDFVSWPKKGGWLLLTPPTLKRQVLYSRKLRKKLVIRIGSFYDWSTIYQIFINREYDMSFFSNHRDLVDKFFVQKSVSRTNLILDLGANIGVAAKYFSVIYPGSKIVSVEAASTNLNLLHENSSTSMNSVVVHAAVGPNDDSVSIFDPGIGNNAFRTFGSREEVIEVVSGVSINSLMSTYGDLEPFIVKIDIEGSEHALFSNNTEWVDKFKVVIVEIHDWMLPGQAISKNLMKTLGAKNRDLLFRGENLFSIRND